MKKILLSIFGLFTISASIAGEANKNLDTTAKIEKFCSISTNDLNFGVLSSPLTAQNASSSMNILCTNNTSYKIDLAYGGVYGQGIIGGNGKTYSYLLGRNDSLTIEYKIYEDSKYLATIACNNNNQVYFYGNSAISSLYGVKGDNTKSLPDNYNACKANRVLNMDTLLKNFGGGDPAYTYGVMNGSFKADKLAYRITLPGDSTKVWNIGNNSYNNKGTGTNQEFAINATIVPDKSSSKYIAQDTYLDTVTATISY